MRVVADTGPLVAAVNRRDEAHRLAAALVTQLGTDLLVPLPVAVEVDHLLRGRVGPAAARLFIRALAGGEHSVAFATPALLRAAQETLAAEIAPIDDIRSTARYRRRITQNLLADFFETLSA